MPKKLRELKASLRKAGFTQRTGKGSHTVWLHPSLDATIVLSGNDGDDAKPYQQRDVDLALRKLEDRNA
jgi:predicted RNA binding protein YcfA (HicA-like mRNA interferase family)